MHGWNWNVFLHELGVVDRYIGIITRGSRHMMSYDGAYDGATLL